MTSTFTLTSCIHGYHIYKDIWDPSVGETVNCGRECGNSEDRFAVALRKDGVIVGHVPRTISCMCTRFLSHGGTITSTVTGPRRYSDHLPQGGMELPCTYKFTGKDSVTKMSHKLLSEESDGVGELQAAGISVGTVDQASLATPQPQGSTSLEVKTEPRSKPSNTDVSAQPSASIRGVKVKTEPIDDDESHDSVSGETQIWVKVRDISLTNIDKEILRSGEKLSDKHINFAQRLLKAKFPKINGLRLTLLHDKAHKDPTHNALQVFHTGGDHWICATTIGTAGKRVSVYDSAHTKWDEPTLCLLKKQFHCSPSNITILKNVQKQQGGKECGLYAIANATSVAHGKDPLKMNYTESLMREHLTRCFSNGTLELFP